MVPVKKGRIVNWEDSNFITLKDLGIAYRKAKADLYYENGHANAIAVCEYEQNLRLNLEALYNKLCRNSLKWMIRPEFVGEWSVIPKGINDYWQDNGPRLRWSDPDKHGEHGLGQGNRRSLMQSFA
jgi:hypothetical protein